MTYIFIVIAIAVINALSTKKVSYIELFFTNMFIIVLAYFVERYFGKVKNESLVIDYEIIEHIPSGQRNVLIENLKKRLNAKPHQKIYFSYIKYGEIIPFMCRFSQSTVLSVNARCEFVLFSKSRQL